MSLFKRNDSSYWWVKFTHNGRRIQHSTGTADQAKAQEYHDKLKASLWDQTSKPIRSPRSLTWSTRCVRRRSIYRSAKPRTMPPCSPRSRRRRCTNREARRPRIAYHHPSLVLHRNAQRPFYAAVGDSCCTLRTIRGIVPGVPRIRSVS